MYTVLEGDVTIILFDDESATFTISANLLKAGFMPDRLNYTLTYNRHVRLICLFSDKRGGSGK